MHFRLTITLFACLLFLMTPRLVFSQDDILRKKIAISFLSATHEQYLDTIFKQSGIEFGYSDAIRPSEIDTIKPGVYSIKAILDSLFQYQNIQYVLRKGAIILSTRPTKNTDEEKIVVQGKVIAHRNEPIPYATAFFARKSLGTLSNAEGEFRILVPSELQSDTLTVSCIGYEDRLITPSEYLAGNLEIKLKTLPISLKSLMIRHEDPTELVEKSFKNRAKNYSTKTVLLSAFFREASRQDEDYISLSEALIEVNKSSYMSNAEDLIRLVKGRNGTNARQSELVNLTVEGGLYNGLRLDVAKYTSYFYSESCIEDNNYRLIKTIYIGGRETHVIGFDMKPGLNYAGYRGRLYIDARSLALVRAEFELSPEGIEYAKSVLIKKTPREYKAYPASAKYEVEYRFYNDSWNLYYAKSEINIEVVKTRGKKDRGFNCNFVSIAEFVVTGISEKPDERMRMRESAGPGDVLVEQVANTGNLFWTDENVILPEEPLLQTINKLQEEGIIKPKDQELGKE